MESDQRIPEKIMDIGTAHTLHKFVPKFSVFACKLQPKHPSYRKHHPKLIFIFSKPFLKKFKKIVYYAMKYELLFAF